MNTKDRPSELDNKEKYIVAKSIKSLFWLLLFFLILIVDIFWLKSITVRALFAFSLCLLINLYDLYIFYLFDDKIIIKKYIFYPFFRSFVIIEINQIVDIVVRHSHSINIPSSLIINYIEDDEEKKIDCSMRWWTREKVRKYAERNNILFND